MKKLIRISGMTAFWMSWPLLYVYLKFGERTRVLLVAGDKILLVRTWHGPGDWSLPGGGIHKNEEPTVAATRELMEETAIGLGTDQLKPLGTHRHTEYGLAFTCHYFLVELPQPILARPKLPEILEAMWVPRAELGSYDLAPDTKHALSVTDALVQ